MTPQMPPTTVDQLDPDLRRIVETAIEATRGADNLYLTLALHPGLARRYLPFAGKLLGGGKLAERTRELAILRTAWRCKSDYEWGQHERISRAGGMELEEVRGLAGNDPGSNLPDHEKAVVEACDQLIDDHVVAPGTWDVLVAHYGDVQTIELVMLIGNYTMLAGFLNSLGVQREPGVSGLPIPCGMPDEDRSGTGKSDGGAGKGPTKRRHDR